MAIQKKAKPKIEKIYPLTPLQSGILAFTKLYGDSMYIVQKKISLEGILDKEAISQTLNYLTQRYEVLRTFFVTVGVKEPMQAILRERKMIPEYIDLSDKIKEEQDAFINDYMETARKKGFDLTKDMLFRFTVVTTGEQSYELLWTIHHIILDGWSTGILLSDFIEIYTDICNKRPVQAAVRNEFVPYVNWLRSKDQKDIDFWKDYLAEYNAAVSVEGKELGNGSFSYKPNVISYFMEDTICEKVYKMAKQEGVTVNILLEAVWGILLQKSNYTNDVVFGYVSSGRNIQLDGIENMVGLMINTIPLRVRTEKDDSFCMLIRNMQESYAQIQQYEYSSLAEIQATTELKNNLINQIMVFENYPFDESLNSEENVKKRGFKILGVDGNEQTNYDLNVIVIPTERLEIKFMYNGEVLQEDELKTIAERFFFILKQIIENPDILCRDITLCFEEEKEKLLTWSKKTECDFPHDVCIHDIFRNQAKKAPDNIAVKMCNKQITYKELDMKSDQLATTLRKMGIGRDKLVGLCVEKSIELIVGMLAILKAGGAYVPMDPDYPSDRLQYMMVQAKADIMLVGKKEIDVEIQKINVCEEKWYDQGTEDISNINEQMDAAYVIFTSGTTGNPKGVLIQHRNVVRLLFNEKFQFDFNDKDVWTMFHSACFDFSVWEIYGALLYGGKLVLVSKDKAKDSREVVKLLYDEKVTVLNQVPSSLYNLIQFAEEPIESLRYLVTGGEALTPFNIMDFKKKNPQLKTINMYGITETTVHTTYKEITIEDAKKEVSNIGTPLPTLDVYIMNEDALCGVGIVGEICVAGEGLARGYLNQPELTAQKFTNSKTLDGLRIYRSGDLGRWLPTGEIEYMGRADEQVKVRGFRIELKEIEEVLLKQEGISNAVVLVKQNQFQDKQLCAFIVGQKIDYEVLKEKLSEKLPEYMIPTKYVTIDKIPVTKNGKADKSALRSMELQEVIELADPETETEEKLCHIFEEILHIDKIGAKDNFFVRGGHSLTATILEAKITQVFQVNLPLAFIFKQPTVRQIAANIEALMGAEGPGKQNAVIPNVGEKDAYELSYYQENLWSTVSMGNDNGTLNIILPFILKNIQADILEKTVRALLDRHEALRTRITLVDGVPMQKICSVDETMKAFIYENAADKSFEMESVLDKEYGTPFDLLKDSLARIKVIRTKENEHVFLLTIHHIIADAWSFDILFEDMCKLYQSFANNQELRLTKNPIRYVDFSLWQKQKLQGVEKENLSTYWKEQLKQPIPVLKMNTDFQRPNMKDVVGEGIDITYDKEFLENVKRFANATHTSVFMVLLSGVYVLLNKYSGQKDIVIGTPIAGREQLQLKNLVGYFLNILPLRLNMTELNTVEELLEKVKAVTIGAYDHQAYPFSMMLEDVKIKRDATHSPLFDVMVQQINTSNENIMKSGEVTMEVYQRKSSQSKYDLVFNFLQMEHELKLRLEYSTLLFKKETILRLLSRYQFILEKMIQDKQKLLSDIKQDEMVNSLGMSGLQRK